MIFAITTTVNLCNNVFNHAFRLVKIYWSLNFPAQTYWGIKNWKCSFKYSFSYPLSINWIMENCCRYCFQVFSLLGLVTLSKSSIKSAFWRKGHMYTIGCVPSRLRILSWISSNLKVEMRSKCSRDIILRKVKEHLLSNIWSFEYHLQYEHTLN